MVKPALTVSDVCAIATLVTPHALTMYVIVPDVAELACGVLSVAVTVNVYVPGGVVPQVEAIVIFEVPVFPPPDPLTGFVTIFTVVPAG